ncbi:MAG TPA: SAM-dependent methyltransferase, partial [Candidatus Limnocylindrales bacterium]
SRHLMDPVAGFRRLPPPGPLPESDPVLVARLRDEILRDGPVTYAHFMDVALYDPQRGYYAGESARPGREGDFLTAPETHPIFGHVLARTLSGAWDTMGRPDPFTLVEYAAGSGALALATLDGLRRDGSPLLEALRYCPIEPAERRLDELVQRLDAAGFGAHVTRGPAHPPAVGCVLANELLDALPFHRAELRDGRLREVLVGWDPGGERFVDVAADPTTPALEQRLRDDGVELADGQRAEIRLGDERWIDEAGRSLERGMVLVFDYGHEARELYGPARRGGTLRTYLRHMVASDPYGRVGRQDITAHVDLTALVRAATRAGLTHLGTTRQSDFLVGSGLGELLNAIQGDPATTLADYTAVRSAVIRMLDPVATGGFAVVAFGRDVPAGILPGLAWRLPRR